MLRKLSMTPCWSEANFNLSHSGCPFRRTLIFPLRLRLAGELDPGRSLLEGDDICIALRLKRRCRVIGSYARQLGRLLHAQASLRRELRSAAEADANCARLGIHLHAVERPCIKCQPQAQRSHVNPRAEGIERRDLNSVALDPVLPPNATHPNSG